jgi:thiosulfate dehydrogenase
VRFLAGLIVGVLLAIALIAIGVYVYFSAGLAPVSTAAQPMPFERKLAKMALHARAEKEMPKTAPWQPSEADYKEAAHQYLQHCAVCHGIPGKPQTAISRGEFPKPPELFKGTGVTDDPPGETYWKIAHGIRLTGMPAFAGTLSERQIWQISFLLAHADKLPPFALAALNSEIQ